VYASGLACICLTFVDQSCCSVSHYRPIVLLSLTLWTNRVALFRTLSTIRAALSCPVDQSCSSASHFRPIVLLCSGRSRPIVLLCPALSANRVDLCHTFLRVRVHCVAPQYILPRCAPHVMPKHGCAHKRQMRDGA
jgi:hypothetical protein